MIDNQLIESAKFIRKEYLSLNSSLEKYQGDVSNLGNFLLSKVEDIKNYKNDVMSKMKSKEDLSKVTDHLVKELKDIEDEEKKLVMKVDSINQKLEKLKKDEDILYDTIKLRYPNLTDDEIKKEIHSHLEE